MDQMYTVHALQKAVKKLHKETKAMTDARPGESRTKKSTKSKKKDSSRLSLTAGPEPDGQYIPTGRFPSDFIQLCKCQPERTLSPPPFAYRIPPIVPRPRRPPAVTPSAAIFESSCLPTPRRSSSKTLATLGTRTGPRNSTGMLSTSSIGDTTQKGPVTMISFSDGTELAFAPEPPPRTFVVRNDRLAYFQPSIQAEVVDGKPDPSSSINELYVRGWRVTDAVMSVFAKCWPAMSSLNTVNLWYAGLTDNTLNTLASTLSSCRTLTTLILDGNPVASEHWDLLIQETSHIQYLALRYCDISDIGAAYIGHAVGSAAKQNSRLLTLDLAGNHIGDKGARSLAGGLRLNRTLLVLCLAGNRIGDIGVRQLAKSLSKFALEHEEVVERRRLLATVRIAAVARMRQHHSSSSVSRRRLANNKGSMHSPSGHRRSRGGKKQPRQSQSLSPNNVPSADSSIDSGRHESEIDIDDLIKQASARQSLQLGSASDRSVHKKSRKSAGSVSPARSSRKKSPEDGHGKSKRKTSYLAVDAASSSTSIVRSSSGIAPMQDYEIAALEAAAEAALRHPLLQVVLVGSLRTVTIVRGNWTLVSLNVARNVIGESGIQSLLHAVDWSNTARRKVTADGRSDAESPPGLLRLVVDNNPGTKQPKAGDETSAGWNKVKDVTGWNGYLASAKIEMYNTEHDPLNQPSAPSPIQGQHSTGGSQAQLKKGNVTGGMN